MFKMWRNIQLQYLYIYNRKQALFFIKNGAIPIDIGVGKKRDVDHKFIKDDFIEKLNNQWIDRKEEQFAIALFYLI